MINVDSTFKFMGKEYDLPTFTAAFCPDQTPETALEVVRVMERKGSVAAVKHTTPELKALEKAMKEQDIVETAAALEQEAENYKDFVANQKRSGLSVHGLVEVAYPSYAAAMNAKAQYEEVLRIQEIDVIQRGAIVLLGFHNITDKELAYISRTYKADKAVEAVVGTLDKGVGAVTGGVDYAARKVVSPTLQIGAKATASIFKSLLHTAAKTGATLISATGQGVRDTKQAIQYDADVIKASRELIEVKDAVKRTVAGHTSSIANGINVIS